MPENKNDYNLDGVNEENIPQTEPESGTGSDLVHMGQNAVDRGKSIAHGVNRMSNPNNDLARGVSPAKRDNNGNLDAEKNPDGSNNLPGEKNKGNLDKKTDDKSSNEGDSKLNTKNNPNNQNDNMMPGQKKKGPEDGNQNNNMMPGQKNNADKKDTKSKAESPGKKVSDKKTPDKKSQGNKPQSKKPGDNLNKKRAKPPVPASPNLLNRLKSRFGGSKGSDDDNKGSGVVNAATTSLFDKIKLAAKDGIVKLIAILPPPITTPTLIPILAICLI